MLSHVSLVPLRAEENKKQVDSGIVLKTLYKIRTFLRIKGGSKDEINTILENPKALEEFITAANSSEYLKKAAEEGRAFKTWYRKQLEVDFPRITADFDWALDPLSEVSDSFEAFLASLLDQKQRPLHPNDAARLARQSTQERYQLPQHLGESQMRVHEPDAFHDLRKLTRRNEEFLIDWRKLRLSPEEEEDALRSWKESVSDRIIKLRLQNLRRAFARGISNTNQSLFLMESQRSANDPNKSIDLRFRWQVEAFLSGLSTIEAITVKESFPQSLKLYGSVAHDLGAETRSSLKNLFDIRTWGQRSLAKQREIRRDELRVKTPNEVLVVRTSPHHFKSIREGSFISSITRTPKNSARVRLSMMSVRDTLWHLKLRLANKLSPPKAEIRYLEDALMRDIELANLQAFLGVSEKESIRAFQKRLDERLEASFSWNDLERHSLSQAAQFSDAFASDEVDISEDLKWRGLMESPDFWGDLNPKEFKSRFKQLKSMAALESPQPESYFEERIHQAKDFVSKEVRRTAAIVIVAVTALMMLLNTTAKKSVSNGEASSSAQSKGAMSQPFQRSFVSYSDLSNLSEKQMDEASKKVIWYIYPIDNPDLKSLPTAFRVATENDLESAKAFRSKSHEKMRKRYDRISLHEEPESGKDFFLFSRVSVRAEGDFISVPFAEEYKITSLELFAYSPGADSGGTPLVEGRDYTIWFDKVSRLYLLSLINGSKDMTYGFYMSFKKISAPPPPNAEDFINLDPEAIASTLEQMRASGLTEVSKQVVETMRRPDRLGQKEPPLSELEKAFRNSAVYSFREPKFKEDILFGLNEFEVFTPFVQNGRLYAQCLGANRLFADFFNGVMSRMYPRGIGELDREPIAEAQVQYLRVRAPESQEIFALGHATTSIRTKNGMARTELDVTPARERQSPNKTELESLPRVALLSKTRTEISEDSTRTWVDDIEELESDQDLTTNLQSLHELKKKLTTNYFFKRLPKSFIQMGHSSNLSPNTGVPNQIALHLARLVEDYARGDQKAFDLILELIKIHFPEAPLAEARETKSLRPLLIYLRDTELKKLNTISQMAAQQEPGNFKMYANPALRAPIEALLNFMASVEWKPIEPKCENFLKAL